MKKICVKKILKKEKPAFAFGGKYRFSPYMACGHRCTYCDGRYEKYHVEGDFDHDIIIRENAPELLERELPKLRESGPVCISSGVSDPYQSVEEQLEITRRCAEVLSRFDHPVIVHTKSSLVLRDIDYWEEVHKKSAFTLMISLTMVDDCIRNRLEPGASSIQERLKTLKEFRKRGINAGVLAMPFIPFLTDSSGQMEEFLSVIKSAGVQFAMPGILTLKSGHQKDFFLAALASNPRLHKKMVDLYSNENHYGNPSSGYVKSFYGNVNTVWSRNKMNDMIPHSVFQDQFSLFDEISILLRDMLVLYKRKDINTAGLKTASRKFTEWLEPRRTFYARRRNLHYSALEAEVKDMIQSGELGKVMGNQRLNEFLHKVIKGGVFNYQTLEV